MSIILEKLFLVFWKSFIAFFDKSNDITKKSLTRNKKGYKKRKSVTWKLNKLHLFLNK